MGARGLGRALVKDTEDGPSPALPHGTDPVERTRQLRRAHAVFTREGRVDGQVRAVIAGSWRRAARARLSPECAPSVEWSQSELRARRAGHPLARALPVVRELVGAFAARERHLLAVCDARGTLLWVEGDPGTLRRAEGLGFVPGARWAESTMGTNAPGTAVALGEPVQVFGAEHFSRRAHAWTCAAAPIRDPRTGRVLGAVDITGGDALAHPHSLAFVQAVARAAEAQAGAAFGTGPEDRRAGPGPGPDVLTALGRDEALWWTGGRTVRLGRRHSEIVVLLAHRPEGLTGEELTAALYEDERAPAVTLRAEIARLRAVVGAEAVASRPYRLTRPTRVDFRDVARLLATGATSAALAEYGGPLLPASTAPGVVRLRERLAEQARAALVARADVGLLTDWVCAPWGEDDVTVWRALAAALPGPRRPAALARSRSLDAELGWSGDPGPRREGRATSSQPARS
ncbi:GAF domain-containing protein [Streptomyces sp. BI20]|uniref:GAF domain-containing protein n=1 Tax=Streptomyces sp. BI20 TaxID=3403460 RepID=UPI003C736651